MTAIGAAVLANDAASPAPGAADEERLLARATAGDEAALAALVRRHQGRVFSIAFHVLGDPAQAEEVAQDVFLRLFRRLGRIDGPEHLVRWLRQVASRRAIDALRRNRLRAAVPLDAVPELATTPADPYLAHRLRRLVAALPGHQRLALALRYGEGLTPQEMAAVLGLPVNTVKSRLQRALARLRRGLEPGEEER